jgi:hypothetical protein
MTTSTTAVEAGKAASGITRAIVDQTPGTHLFREYDWMGYSDPNVPGGQNRVACWVFGDFNPAAETDQRGQNPGNHPIFGWNPRKKVNQNSGSC